MGFLRIDKKNTEMKFARYIGRVVSKSITSIFYFFSYTVVQKEERHERHVHVT